MPAKSAVIFLSVLLLAPLLVFLKRPFHIDDPLFIWVARHIQTDPLNPYGFAVNWYGFSMRMSEVTKNPPLASYYIALMAFFVGWSEPALHLVFAAAAIAVAIGTYLISERFCQRPLLATLAALLTPVFFVSSLTVMCDVLMLSFWVFAVYFWMKGVDGSNHRSLLVGALLIAASSLTKYFGMVLVPLLFGYSLFRKRRIGWWSAYLAIPIVILGWYQWITHRLYSRGLLLDAATYATQMKTDLAIFPIAKSYVAFAFTGGCIATVLFFCRQLWSRAVIIGGVLFMLAAALVFANVSSIGSLSLPSDKSMHILLGIQLALWGTAGISLIALAALDLYRQRDSESLFLFTWIIGTFLFAGFINWTMNGRSNLPMTIPAGIVIARRLELRASPTADKMLPATVVPLLAGLALSFAVAWADTTFADTARKGAIGIHEYYSAGRTVWFQGHWGFQYYMEQMGGKPADIKEPVATIGDVMAVPTTNTNVFALPSDWPARKVFDVPSTGWITTMNYQLGAGFYADVLGPLPFVIGPVMPERFTVFEIKP